MAGTVASEFEKLVEALAKPEAYPFPVDEVKVAQTHISVVFLAGEHAYKIKKPVSLGFLDYSTPEKRRLAAEAEVRLNRRLAPGVYLGTVPITEEGGRILVGGPGRELERAVRMQRLPDDRSLRALLQAGALTPDVLRRLARRLAAFYPGAGSDPAIAAAGSFRTVAGNCRENFAQLRPFVGRTISAEVLDRLERATEWRLAQLRPRIEARCKAGVPRDTHGDLRLEHVYWFPDRPEPHDLLVIDCIEFNDRFRWADPVADVAFLAMELEFYGSPGLARTFTDEYFAVSGDLDGAALLPFYVAYRHVVRGKVRSFQADTPGAEPARRAQLLAHARAHFLPALGHLEEPGARPCLILMTGLPGTGKSTLSRRLESADAFTRVSTDRVRRELIAAAGGAGRGGPYTAEWTARTYAACRARVAALLEDGRRVVMDGTLRTDADRIPFLELAAEARVPAVLFACECDPEEVRRRLDGRTGDESEADWGVYRKLAQSWVRPGPGLAPVFVPVSTTAGTEAAWREVRGELAERGLAPPSWGRTHRAWSSATA